jgi:GNAT superfamily N-acetyltransferase
LKGVRIRKATQDDRLAVEELVASGARDLRKRIGPHPNPIAMADLAGRGCNVLVAVNGDRVVGSIAYRIRGGRLHLFNLVVETRHRKKGIARRLLLALEDEALRSGAKYLSVQTLAELNIAPLFGSLNYRIHSTKREFLLSPDRERALTTVYMVKRMTNSHRHQRESSE